MSNKRISPLRQRRIDDMTALRFFFKATLERPDFVRHPAPVQRPRKAPIVLSPEEVARLPESAPGLKY